MSDEHSPGRQALAEAARLERARITAHTLREQHQRSDDTPEQTAARRAVAESITRRTLLPRREDT